MKVKLIADEKKQQLEMGKNKKDSKKGNDIYEKDEKLCNIAKEATIAAVTEDAKQINKEKEFRENLTAEEEKTAQKVRETKAVQKSVANDRNSYSHAKNLAFKEIEAIQNSSVKASALDAEIDMAAKNMKEALESAKQMKEKVVINKTKEAKIATERLAAQKIETCRNARDDAMAKINFMKNTVAAQNNEETKRRKMLAIFKTQVFDDVESAKVTAIQAKIDKSENTLTARETIDIVSAEKALNEARLALDAAKANENVMVIKKNKIISSLKEADKLLMVSPLRKCIVLILKCLEDRIDWELEQFEKLAPIIKKKPEYKTTNFQNDWKKSLLKAVELGVIKKKEEDGHEFFVAENWKKTVSAERASENAERAKGKKLDAEKAVIAAIKKVKKNQEADAKAKENRSAKQRYINDGDICGICQSLRAKTMCTQRIECTWNSDEDYCEKWYHPQCLVLNPVGREKPATFHCDSHGGEEPKEAMRRWDLNSLNHEPHEIMDDCSDSSMSFLKPFKNVKISRKRRLESEDDYSETSSEIWKKPILEKYRQHSRPRFPSTHQPRNQAAARQGVMYQNRPQSRPWVVLPQSRSQSVSPRVQITSSRVISHQANHHQQGMRLPMTKRQNVCIQVLDRVQA